MFNRNLNHMKKLIILTGLLLFGCLPLFCASSTIAGVDSNTILLVVSGILATCLGHFTIPTKWSSPIHYLFIISNALTKVLEAANNSNNSGVVKEQSKIVEFIGKAADIGAESINEAKNTQQNNKPTFIPAKE